jgi:uncharacterized membrane protein YgaE (UPF0421/DUF939 family)
MKIFKKYQLVGGRTVKTSIAVFVTALICHLLNWPTMFAVITAIVTIEPTVADSIKKAYVRFPASVIGAALAVLFTFLLGDSPLSYALVALFTIIACHKLKLYDGTLVATLTGVAMISTVQDDYITSFLIRLGTTSTGLIVSTFVNFFIMPPKYSVTIKNEIYTLYMKCADLLNKKSGELFHRDIFDKNIQDQFQTILKDIEKAETLCKYQKDEWRYHRFHRKDIRKIYYECKKLTALRKIAYHIGNLVYLPWYKLEIDEVKRELLLSTIQSYRSSFYSRDFSIHQHYHQSIKAINEWFHLSSERIKNGQSTVSTETSILYELLSINDLVEELSHIHSSEAKRSKCYND